MSYDIPQGPPKNVGSRLQAAFVAFLWPDVTSVRLYMGSVSVMHHGGYPREWVARQQKQQWS